MARRKAVQDPGVNTYVDIEVSRLHLHGDNYRHEPLRRESEIIDALCDSQLVALATDIATLGRLSPIEVLGVMPDPEQPGHYIALEGNRRTCALILLRDPKRAPSKLQVSFTRLAQQAQLQNLVRAYVFRDRESAQPWIERRHLGDQGGVGTREWSADAQARAAIHSSGRTTAKANLLALAVLDRLQSTGRLADVPGIFGPGIS